MTTTIFFALLTILR